MKYKPKLENRNIIIVYLNKNLKFETLIPGMKEYVFHKYTNFEADINLRKDLMDAVSNLKNLFEQVYQTGMVLYASIHGKIEVDILINALKPHIIRTGYLSGTKDKSIIPISDNNMDYIKKKIKCEFNMDDLMKEIKDYLKG